MQNFLLMESRDSFDCRDAGFCVDLARSLAGAGHSVTLLLVQNGVLSARATAHAAGIAELVAAGVTVLADRFSLSERGIPEHRLAGGIRSTALDVVVDRMIDGWNVIWH
jgi:hypothetical protein